MHKNKNVFYFFTVLFLISLMLIIHIKKQDSNVFVVNYANSRVIEDSINGIKSELGQEDINYSRISYINGCKGTYEYLKKNVRGNDIVVAVGEKAVINLKILNCQKIITNVVDPISIGVTEALQNQKNDVTGVTDKIPLNLYIDLIYRLKSDIKLIGIIYFENSKNSKVQISTIRNICKTKGIKLKLLGLKSKKDINKITYKKYKKIGMIFIPIDDQANNYIKDISVNAFKEKIPIIVSDEYALKKGATASICISYYSLGKQVGQYVLRVLNGEKARNIYFETEKKVTYKYNKIVMKKLGLNFKE